MGDSFYVKFFYAILGIVYIVDVREFLTINQVSVLSLLFYNQIHKNKINQVCVLNLLLYIYYDNEYL